MKIGGLSCSENGEFLDFNGTIEIQGWAVLLSVFREAGCLCVSR